MVSNLAQNHGSTSQGRLSNPLHCLFASQDQYILFILTTKLICSIMTLTETWNKVGSMENEVGWLAAVKCSEWLGMQANGIQILE